MSDLILFDTTFVLVFFGILILLGIISGITSEKYPEHSDMIGAISIILCVIYWTLLVVFEMGGFI